MDLTEEKYIYKFIAASALFLFISIYSLSVRGNELDLFNLVQSGDDLYIGEIHGTKEIPELIHALVEFAINDQQQEKLAVILELPSTARDFKSYFWSGLDGRSSVSMAALVSGLIKLEGEGYIELFFQLEGYDYSNFSLSTYEEHLGRFVDDKLDSYQVIAYGGSAHSAKNRFSEDVTYYPAGHYIRNITSIYVAANQPYSFWGCLQAGCSEHSSDPSAELLKEPGSLIDGEKIHHDYIYIIGGLTASPPLHR